jgi:hypothetical protein
MGGFDDVGPRARAIGRDQLLRIQLGVPEQERTLTPGRLEQHHDAAIVLVVGALGVFGRRP